MNQSAGGLAVSIKLGVICIRSLYLFVEGLCWGRSARCPGGEQAQTLGRGRAGFGGVDHQDEAGFGGDGELLVGEGQLADDGVVEPLGAGAMGADVVVGPQAPEGLALGGELTDEVLESAVVGVAPGLGAHDPDAHLGEQLPVGVEVAGGGVEELEPRQVGHAGHRRR